MCFINKESSRDLINTIKALLKVNEISKKNLDFMSLFNKLLSEKHVIKNHYSEGNWAELDNLADFYSFTFGNKSKTLKNLKGKMDNGKVLTQVSFNVGEWEANKNQIIKEIKNHFTREKLIVRSSSLSEDSHTSSMAGKFESILGVDRDDNLSIIKSVQQVIDSFGESRSNEDIVFVQPLLPDVLLSGVAFTCDISTGSPYLCVNLHSHLRLI